MARWYQHVFTGQQVEVKTLDEDDKYVGVSAWARIDAPSAPAPVADEEKKAPVARKKKAG
jgi:hypothetical protein